MPEYKHGLRAQKLDVFTTCTHGEGIIEAKSFGNQLDGRTGEVLLISNVKSSKQNVNDSHSPHRSTYWRILVMLSAFP